MKGREDVSAETPVPKQSIESLRAEVGASFHYELASLAPSITEFSASFLYGQVWSRTDKLSERDRSLVTIAALAALDAGDGLKMQVLRGLTNGLSKEEVGEIFTHLAGYIGFPRAVNGVAAVADIVARADVGDSADSAA
jgi:4-carboxymuconolactone decarboxylase